MEGENWNVKCQRKPSKPSAIEISQETLSAILINFWTPPSSMNHQTKLASRQTKIKMGTKAIHQLGRDWPRTDDLQHILTLVDFETQNIQSHWGVGLIEPIKVHILRCNFCHSNWQPSSVMFWCNNWVQNEKAVGNSLDNTADTMTARILFSLSQKYTVNTPIIASRDNKKALPAHGFCLSDASEDGPVYSSSSYGFFSSSSTCLTLRALLFLFCPHSSPSRMHRKVLRIRSVNGFSRSD